MDTENGNFESFTKLLQDRRRPILYLKKNQGPIFESLMTPVFIITASHKMLLHLNYLY